MRLHSLSAVPDPADPSACPADPSACPADPAAALSPPYPCARIPNVGTISPIRTVPLKSSPIRTGLCLLDYRELTLHSPRN